MFNLKKTFLLLCFVGVSLTGNPSISKIMKHFKIIPDLIDEGPIQALKISYNHDVEVNGMIGAELMPDQVSIEPEVEWTTDYLGLYTLIMVNLDAPTRADPKLREWIHWLVCNIPANEIAQGDVLSPYVGCISAPADKDFQRFVFLLYKQQQKLNFDEQHFTNKTTMGRAMFSTKKFVKKYNLGLPIAGNFFLARYDDFMRHQWG